MRSSSATSVVVGTRNSSSHPSCSSAAAASASVRRRVAARARRHRLRQLVAEDAEVVERVALQPPLGAVAEGVPEAGRDVRRLVASRLRPRRPDPFVDRADRAGFDAGHRRRVVDAGGPARRPYRRLRSHHAGDDGRTAGLDGWRADRVGTLERRLARPDRPHGRDLLVHPRPPPAHVAADGPVVVLPAADADADREPAVAQPVDGREVLRHLDRVVRREHHHGRPQPHPVRECGRRRQLHDPGVARVRDPLGHGQARERALVDRPAPGQHLGAAVGQHRRQGHRDLHHPGVNASCPSWPIRTS